MNGTLHSSWEGLQFLMVSSFLEPAGFLKPQGAPKCLSDASQVLLRCFKNYNFGYESGPHGSPRHDTLSQRSATPPRSFLSPSQAPEIPFSIPNSQNIKHPNKYKKITIFPMIFGIFGSTVGFFGAWEWLKKLRGGVALRCDRVSWRGEPWGPDS